VIGFPFTLFRSFSPTQEPGLLPRTVPPKPKPDSLWGYLSQSSHHYLVTRSLECLRERRPLGDEVMETLTTALYLLVFIASAAFLYGRATKKIPRLRAEQAPRFKFGVVRVDGFWLAVSRRRFGVRWTLSPTYRVTNTRSSAASYSCMVLGLTRIRHGERNPAPRAAVR